MASLKVAITLEQETLCQVDSLVARRLFQNRSRVIQNALHERIERAQGGRLAAECAKLDPKFEQALADEGLDVDAPRGQNSKRGDSLVRSAPCVSLFTLMNL
jgi:Arc/MetJ-type ribon-helix-helix transcriptional regulator